MQATSLETIVTADAELNLIRNEYIVYMPFGDPNKAPSLAAWNLTFYLSKTISPPRLAGGAVLLHQSIQPLSHPQQSWLYIASQRRSRRAPDIGYDTLMPHSKGIRVVDEIGLFNGALDRYNWKTLGKKEVVIPYNNNKLDKHLNKAAIHTLLTPFHLNPELTRFERHRAWVIEGTLKDGLRHIYKKRMFYIDEDSYQIMLADMYNRNDEMVRTSIRYPSTNKDIPGIVIGIDAYHDFNAKRYFIQGLSNENLHFSSKGLDKSVFSPKALRKFATSSEIIVK